MCNRSGAVLSLSHREEGLALENSTIDTSRFTWDCSSPTQGAQGSQKGSQCRDLSTPVLAGLRSCMSTLCCSWTYPRSALLTETSRQPRAGGGLTCRPGRTAQGCKFNATVTSTFQDAVIARRMATLGCDPAPSWATPQGLSFHPGLSPDELAMAALMKDHRERSLFKAPQAVAAKAAKPKESTLLDLKLTL
ncbi:Mitotic Checkpoint Serine/Threonine-Protein Kinase Bub1 [Manis pentadactyla]|nr:Mitotic Checkpoint Serine/Threonine-Protein Kinase Bub1 [Manis pentadactyla]